MELDLFVEEIALAVEVQGRQHLEYIPHFHNTYAEFQKQQKRDKLKRHACTTQDVTLIEILDRADFAIILEKAKAQKPPNEKWDTACNRRRELERLFAPKIRAIAKKLSNLHRRLERWRRKALSEKRTHMLRSIEGQLAIENKCLLDELKHSLDQTQQLTHKPLFFNESVDRADIRDCACRPAKPIR